MFLYHWGCDFQGFKVSQGMLHMYLTGGKLNHLLMAYLLSNIHTKNYRSWTTNVKIIIDGWVGGILFSKHSVVWASEWDIQGGAE